VGIGVDIMVIVVVDIVVGVDVVSWLSDMRSRVVVVRVTGDEWVDGVLFSVLVLSGVGILVALSVSVVSVGWLSVGVLVNVNNIVMVWVMRVVRVSSGVDVSGLVVVMNSLVINWNNLVLSPSLSVMGDSLVWHSNVPFSSVVLMSVVWVSEVVIAMSLVSVFEGDSAVLILLVVGTVLNFVISLMIFKFVSNGVMFSLSTFDVWSNLVDSSLLKRSMV